MSGDVLYYSYPGFAIVSLLKFFPVFYSLVLSCSSMGENDSYLLGILICNCCNGLFVEFL